MGFVFPKEAVSLLILRFNSLFLNNFFPPPSSPQMRAGVSATWQTMSREVSGRVRSAPRLQSSQWPGPSCIPGSHLYEYNPPLTTPSPCLGHLSLVPAVWCVQWGGMCRSPSSSLIPLCLPPLPKLFNLSRIVLSILSGAHRGGWYDE